MDLFPPELLEKVLGHLPPDDKQSLRNCSLVAKSWIHPSRARLFKTVNVMQRERLWSWSTRITPENAELLRHVRSLFCGIYTSPGEGTDPVHFLRCYFPSLPQLRLLLLTSGHLQSVTQIGVPFGFQYTLKHLSLCDCRTTISALATVINYFPNLDQLDLHYLSHEVDSQPTPPLSRALRKISVTEPDTRDDLGILDQLFELGPQCDEISIKINALVAPSLIQRVINGVETSVKRVSLKPHLHHSEDLLTFSRCRELRELEMCLISPENSEADLLSSITSTNMQKIIFAQSYAFCGSFMGSTYWPRLDDSLCQLVGQLGCEHLLEVEFRALAVPHGELDIERYLPMFYKKGRVRIVHELTKMIIYCSDRAERS